VIETTPSWVYLFLGFYFFTSGILFVYGAHAYMMAFLYLRAIRKTPPEPPPGPLLPVTIQLPIYNERYVIGRLLEAVTRLDYPKHLVEIQILDDSTDETVVEAAALVAGLKSQGWAAVHRHRQERTGYKGGALREGMAEASGSLIAVFDADFLPPPGFLKETVPYFQDPSIGMVQTRWTHLNEGFSSLTRAQAAALDGHFLVEHTVRNRYGAFINFNGTAGIWRKECIQSAGDWQDDTLTEDLDLSYRAQLAGWRFVYAPNVTAPAEVPAELGGFQSQQHRWAKGSAQVARKLASRIARAPIPLRVKLEAYAHLAGNTGYPLVIVLAALLPIVTTGGITLSAPWHLAAFLLCTLSVILFYERGQRALGRSRLQRLLDVPAAMALGVGMSLAQTRAVLSGIFCGTGEFVRTPKRGDAPATARYRVLFGHWPWFELAFAVWFAIGIVRAAGEQLWGSLPFLVLFFFGFTWVGFLSLRERLAARERPAPADPVPETDEDTMLVGGRSPG